MSTEIFEETKKKAEQIMEKLGHEVGLWHDGGDHLFTGCKKCGREARVYFKYYVGCAVTYRCNK